MHNVYWYKRIYAFSYKHYKGFKTYVHYLVVIIVDA